MNLLGGCVIVDDVISSLQLLVGSHFGGQGSVWDNLVVRSDYDYLCSYISVIKDKV
jgi:hypothetical protein